MKLNSLETHSQSINCQFGGLWINKNLAKANRYNAFFFFFFFWWCSLRLISANTELKPDRIHSVCIFHEIRKTIMRKCYAIVHNYIFVKVFFLKKNSVMQKTSCRFPSQIGIYFQSDSLYLLSLLFFLPSAVHLRRNAIGSQGYVWNLLINVHLVIIILDSLERTCHSNSIAHEVTIRTKWGGIPYMLVRIRE